MSHSVSGIKTGSPLQSKSNDNLFAFHMHFPNINIWTICFHLFFCFFKQRNMLLLTLCSAGDGAFWNCHCWGRSCYKSQGLQLHEFYHNKTPTLWPSMHALPSSSRLSGAFSSSRAADRAGSVAGMTSSHTTQLQRQAVCPTFQATAFWGIYLFTHEQ